MITQLRRSIWILWLMPLFLVWACGGGGGGGGTTATGSGGGSGMGTLSLQLVDAPNTDFKAVYVTIGEVQVCIDNGQCADDYEDCDCQWETVATLNRTYNLLELVNGVIENLGQKDLPTGTYHQMRLLLHATPDGLENILGVPHPFPQYVIDENDVVHEMKVPSGVQTGIKLVHPFEIESGLTTELILDFDASKSVVVAGKSGLILLKPTIKVIGTYNRATVSGMVFSDPSAPEQAPEPLAGATVTAWYQDAEGNWVSGMGTLTDETGAYMLYLDLVGPSGIGPKTYQIVAGATGFEPACTTIMAEVDQVYPDTDFILSPVELISVSGTISGNLPAPAPDEYPEDGPIVAVSFNRTVGGCILEPVETAFIQVAEDGAANEYDNSSGAFSYSYEIELPAGQYDVVASTEGLPPLTVGFDLTGPSTLDLTFP